VKPSLLTEVRDWLNAAATGIGLYLMWRWRRSNEGGGTRTPTAVTPPSEPGTIFWTTSDITFLRSEDAGTQAVLDSMAELNPYEFPPN
jgi:hypothetical protein